MQLIGYIARNIDIQSLPICIQRSASKRQTVGKAVTNYRSENGLATGSNSGAIPVHVNEHETVAYN